MDDTKTAETCAYFQEEEDCDEQLVGMAAYGWSDRYVNDCLDGSCNTEYYTAQACYAFYYGCDTGCGISSTTTDAASKTTAGLLLIAVGAITSCFL